MTAWALAIARMLGLGSIAGVRPSLTLIIVGVTSAFGWGASTNPTFSWLGHWLAIGVFAPLAIMESAFDKTPKIDRVQDRLIMPYRMFVGGIAGAATAPFGWQGIVTGAALGAGAAWFAQHAKRAGRPRSVPSATVVTLLSALEDLGVFLGGVLILAVPYTGFAGTVISGAVLWRVRDQRRAKYGELRRVSAKPRSRAAPAAGRLRAPLGAARPDPARSDSESSVSARPLDRAAQGAAPSPPAASAPSAASPSSPEQRAQRRRMVDEQIAARGVRDERVLAAMRAVPRHRFVPDDAIALAYADSPLSIGYGQTISQPYMVALMTSLLELEPGARVLEVGSGSGYQTAVLAEIVPEVFAVERIVSLAERARATLADLGYHTVRSAIGDGALGWPEEAPFDAILVAAATDEVPPELRAQLADGGRLVIPLNHGHGEQILTIVERTGDTFQESHDTRCRFVALIRDGAKRGDEDAAPADVATAAASLAGGSTAEEGETVKAVRVAVSGIVQGVYYRASAQREGERLGLNGWVRNRSDGSVQLHLQGSPAAVDAMLDWCRGGPPAASVSCVAVEDVPVDDALRDFTVR